MATEKRKKGRPTVHKKPDLQVGEHEVFEVSSDGVNSMRASLLGWALRSGIELKTNYDNGFLMVTRVA